MKNNYGDPDQDISFSQSLACYFEAILGGRFVHNQFGGGTRLSAGGAPQQSEGLSPEQEKFLNLLSVAEIQRAAGQYDSLRKTCRLIFSLANDYTSPKMDSRFRDVFLYRLAFLLFGGMGDHLTGKGFAGEALKFYQELSAFFPKDKAATKKIARTFYTMGPNYLQEAERLYRRVLAAYPADLEVAENLGRVLSVSPNGQEEARFIFRDALKHCRTDMDRLRFYSHLLSLSPGDSDIHLRMGRLFQRQGMFIEALGCLEKARKLHGDPQEIPNLAYLYYLLNDFQKAETLLLSLTQGEGKPYYFGRYLLGLINEGDERWDVASDYFREVPPESPYYWKAVMGLARINLHKGNFTGAETLAREIPPGQHAGLGVEFLKFSSMLENALQHESHFSAEEWRKHIKKSLPLFHLKKNVHNRSMGPGFWRKYGALQVLGDGPAGQVLMGRDRQRGTMVAIKHLHRDFLGDPFIIRRLQGLLKDWRNLDVGNPYLVSLYEDCFFEGSFFYAMELMDHNLLSLIKARAPVPDGVAIDIALGICDALAYYYSRHMDGLHGGLKPENILISANNELKISDLDFFSAMAGKRVFQTGDIKKHPSFLQTFLYFAPERFKGRTFFHYFHQNPGYNQGLRPAFEGVDQRADLYSLGILLFQLVTGFLPFDIHSVDALLAFHKSKQAAALPGSINPAINPALEEIIITLMAREPARRFATPGEVKKALGKVQSFTGK